MSRIVLTAALSLAFAAPASAQEPVVGGGSFNAAPLLEPGTYKDTLLGGELLLYGIELKAGQQLRVAVRIRGVSASTYADAVAGVKVSVFSPQRREEVNPIAEDIAGNGDSEQGPIQEADLEERLTFEFLTDPVETLAQSRGAGDYRGPGTWYLGLFGFKGEIRAELPVEFELEAVGEPVVEDPDPTPEPTPVATGTPPLKSDGDGDGAPVIPAGAAGLVLGGLIGGLLGRRRRRGVPDGPGTGPAAS